MKRTEIETLSVPLHDDLDVPVGIDWSKAEIAQVEPRKAPRVPRDTEPCPLWVFALIVAGVGGCMAMVAGWIAYGAGEGLAEVVRYVDAFVVELVRWIGGVL